MTIATSPLSDDAISTIRHRLEKVCRLGDPHEVAGVCIDSTGLSVEEQALFDDGEILPKWAAWWHTQARRIQNLEGAALISLEPGPLGKHRIQAIETDALASLFDTVSWTRCAGVVLAWGVTEQAMDQIQRGPIPCEGALAVAVDGCGALLVCGPDICRSWSW